MRWVIHEKNFNIGDEPRVQFGNKIFGPDYDPLELILASLEFDSATDIVTIDLRNKSSFADHMVIASATSGRLLGSICDKLIKRIKTLGGSKPRVEGAEAGDWALVDAGDIIVHVFRPEVREYYALEKMWAPELATERKETA